MMTGGSGNVPRAWVGGSGPDRLPGTWGSLLPVDRGREGDSHLLGPFVVSVQTQSTQRMKTQIVEVTNGPMNWGKFLVGHFDTEFQRKPAIPGIDGRLMADSSLLVQRGWGRDHFLVLDLETGEGAIFHRPGSPQADLDKHRIWVCPLFEPFLTWLYAQPSIENLPAHVDLPKAPFALQGYRRPGKATSTE